LLDRITTSDYAAETGLKMTENQANIFNQTVKKTLIELSPNPANQFVSIQLNSDFDQTSEFVILNVLSQKVYQDLINERQKYILDVKSFKEGPYFIIVRNKSGLARKKFLVIH